jgi:hypothetical protein
MAYRLLTLVFEFVDDPRPRVARLDQTAARGADRPPADGIAQECNHRVGERGGVIG